MQLFGTSRLESFVQAHEGSRVFLGAWQLEVEEAQWTCPDDVRARYAGAIVHQDRVVFNIKRLYKIEVKARFNQGILLVERVWITAAIKQIRSFAKSAAVRSNS